MVQSTIYEEFTLPLRHWSQLHGRKNLPWQTPRSPYRVWVSEIMLQQTQVVTVITYFTRFLKSFPNVNVLAAAPEDEVLAHWSGLGYYSRARNLHKTAKIISADFQGEFPDNVAALIKLPGIGESTAAAIASLAFNKPAAILDSNVKRVLSRYFLVAGISEKAAVKKQLWQLANACMPADFCSEHTQAIMDLGATCCTPKNPTCSSCPLQNTCKAYQQNLVAHYPYKKLKKILPVKQQQFLLLSTPDHLIYLEKQPPVGLWGGLWCMPSIDPEHCPLTYINNSYHLQSTKAEELMQIKHTFSHFHLHIQALSLKTEIMPNRLAESPGKWFSLEEVTKIGIPKPVSTILNHYFSLVSVKG